MLLYNSKTLSTLKNNSKIKFIFRKLKFYLVFFIFANASLWNYVEGNSNLKLMFINIFAILFIIQILVVISSSIEFIILKRIQSNNSKTKLHLEIVLILINFLILFSFRIIIYPTFIIYDFPRTLIFIPCLFIILNNGRWNFIKKYLT